MATHQDYMQYALMLAERGRGLVSPNPMVGCVIVKDGKIIAEGFHLKAGRAHAEIIALKAAGNLARGASLYITLEPCCHYGRTPPCTDGIIQAGIKNVYVACLDPNPLVSGQGVQALKAVGITVEVGIHEKAALELNQMFFHYIIKRRPFVIAKWAMSLDGKTVTTPTDSRKISGTNSHQHAHAIRDQVDAILIGAETARLDNPQLTVRYHTTCKQPLRIVLTKSGDLPLDLKLWDASLPGKTLVVAAKINESTHRALTIKNIEVIQLPSDHHGNISLAALLDELGRREIMSLLVEGGMRVLEQFFAENLVNQIYVYLAPIIIGTLPIKKVLSPMTMIPLGEDYCFSALYKDPTHV